MTRKVRAEKKTPGNNLAHLARVHKALKSLLVVLHVPRCLVEAGVAGSRGGGGGGGVVVVLVQIQHIDSSSSGSRSVRRGRRRIVRGEQEGLGHSVVVFVTIATLQQPAQVLIIFLNVFVQPARGEVVVRRDEGASQRSVDSSLSCCG